MGKEYKPSGRINQYRLKKAQWAVKWLKKQTFLMDPVPAGVAILSFILKQFNT